MPDNSSIDTSHHDEDVLVLRTSDITRYLNCHRHLYLSTLEGLYPKREGDNKEEELVFADYHKPSIEKGMYLPTQNIEEMVLTVKEGGNADIGNLVHYIIDLHYSGKLGGATLVDIESLVFAHMETMTTIPEHKTWVDVARYATVMSHGFIQWLDYEGLDLAKVPLFTEERLEWEIPLRGWEPGPKAKLQRVFLSGGVDLIQVDTDTGERAVGDHKTVNDFVKQAPRDGNIQLMSYAWLLAKVHGVAPTYVFHNMAKRSLQTNRAKPPFYRRIELNVSKRQLKDFERYLSLKAREILNIANGCVKPRSLDYNTTDFCNWGCHVTPVCDAMNRGGKEWKEMANNSFGGEYRV